MPWRIGAGIVAVIVIAVLLRPSPQGSSSQPVGTPQSAPAAGPRRLAEPLDLVPAESLLTWKGLPYPDTKEHQPGALDVVRGLVTTFFPNVLDPKAKLTLRLLEGFGVVIRYPFAISVIDANAQRIEGGGTGLKSDDLKIAVVLEPRDHYDLFLKLIQSTVNELTDRSAARLERHSAGGFSYQVLVDERLPDWCHIAWGRIDDFFVLTFGTDVWPRIAAVAEGRVMSAADDPWTKSLREKRAREALIEVIVAAREIRKRLDPAMYGRATAFFRAWDAENVVRAHWLLGFQKRAMFCEAYFDLGGRKIHRVYADPSIRERKYLDAVPPDARYAIYRLPVERFLPRLVAAWYATRGERITAHAAEWWERVQKQYKFDDQHDILDNLGDTIVLHNFPLHPLRLPLAFTSLIEIKKNPERVRRTLETMCAAWAESLEEEAAMGNVPNPAMLYRDDDGIWYIQFGPLAGLAWTFTNEFIITSWSPAALREYLDQAGPRVGWSK